MPLKEPVVPRSVGARCGEDGYENEPLRLELTDTDVARLAALLGIDPASAAAQKLGADVTDIGSTYRRWKDRGAGAFARAEARRGLQQLLACEQVNVTSVLALNERAQESLCWALWSLGPRVVPHGESVTAALFEGRLDAETLRRAARDAIGRLEVTKGPNREGEIA